MLNGSWSAENRAALEELLARQYASPPLAVLDWDGTCIYGDVSDAVYHALCESLALRFDAPDLWEWFHETRHADEIRAAYDEYARARTPHNAHRLRYVLEHARYRMHVGYEFDDTEAWAWDTGAFIGWTEEAAREFSRQVIARELARPLAMETLTFDGYDAVQLARGLRIHQAMRELVAQMHNQSWDVWIISATPRWEVEAFAERFDIPPTRVVAMQRVVDANGCITREVSPPVSYDIGKWNAYKQFISPTRRPLFIAGDGAGDWMMLQNSAEVRLLVNPKNEAMIDYARVCAAHGERWLIQEFNADG